MDIKLADMADIIYEQLNSGEDIILTVRGTSMYPIFLDKKTEVTLRKKDSYSKGDVIFYRRDNGAFVLHRIIGKNSEGWILRGDNQTVKEFAVRDDMILGYVVFYKNKKKKSTSSLSFSFYSSIWAFFRFVRRPLCHFLRLFRR